MNKKVNKYMSKYLPEVSINRIHGIRYELYSLYTKLVTLLLVPDQHLLVSNKLTRGNSYDEIHTSLDEELLRITS